MLRAFASGTIFGTQVGEAPAEVLALHGWARDHHDFDDLLERLGRDGIPAASIDLPGFGSAPPPESAWETDRYATFVATMLDELAPRPVVIGHSFGGRVALRLAARCPERVGSLVLVGVPLCPPEGRTRPPFGYRAVRRLRRARLVPERMLEQARQRYGSTDYRRAQGVMRDVLVRSVNERYEDAFERVAVPVELVWGERDDVVPVDQARSALDRLASARLTVVPSTGHLVPSEMPDALYDALARLRP